MVTINPTMLIELGLFLVFLWGTQRYILRPVLKSLDAREESIQLSLDEAEASTAESELLEKSYRHEIAVIRKNADEKVHAARQKTQQEHTTFLIDERTKAEKSIAEVRMEAQKHVEDQQDAINAEVPDLVKYIEAHLNVGGQR